jgi:DNA-binding CsgD family transcriptional regulator
MNASHSARELALALDCLKAIGEGCPPPTEFGKRGVRWLARLVASEITTLSICDLATGRRRVVSDPPHAFHRDALAAFDRHFFEHPLVRFHTSTPRGGVHRISDSLDRQAFRSTALYGEYYRKVGLDHALALPLHVDHHLLVSFVFNRAGRDFSDRERELLELVRPHLTTIYLQSHALAVAQRTLAKGIAGASGAGNPNALGALTPREREVLSWVAAGKTNAQIAQILGTMPRTIAKHLERVYDKLGVETRTAAAMRVLLPAGRVTDALRKPD